jgi:hypothetical protein
MRGGPLHELLRAGRCPVLVVGPEASGVVRSAVVGAAFGVGSMHAADLVYRLLDADGVLSLLHVHPRVAVIMRPSDERGTPALLSAGVRLQRVARAVRDRTVHGLPTDSVAPRSDVLIGTITRFGAVALELLAYARRAGAELLGVGGGHVAEAVLRRAWKEVPTCSVLVCPAPRAR